MSFSKIWSIFLSLCYSSILFAGTIDPSTPDSKYVEYGEKFNCIVSVCGSYQDDTLFCASAVVIDNHHILTAAHVVKDCKTCNVTIGKQKYNISVVTINKDFDKEFGIADIAIGYSEQDFELDFYPPLYTENDEIGKLCCISGYGLTGTFYTGAVNHDGKKRAGSNIIESTYKDLLICTPSRKTSNSFTELEFCIGSGDSGGGLFIDGKLAGINSCVTSEKGRPNSKYGEESGHTRVSQFVDWINENKTKVD